MAMDSRKMFNRYILGFEFIFGHSNIKNLNFFAVFYRLSICVFKYQKKKKVCATLCPTVCICSAHFFEINFKESTETFLS